MKKHTEEREQRVMVKLRVLGFSIHQIAKVLRRSSKTVLRYAGQVGVNNRKLDHHERIRRNQSFKDQLVDLRIRVKLYVEGTVETLDEAFTTPSIPIGGLDLLQKSKHWYKT